MTAAPVIRLYALALILCADFFLCAKFASSVGSPAYLVTLAIASVVYLLAIRELTQTPHYPLHAIVICLIFAAAWQAPFFRAVPGEKDDILRYVWDGHIQRAGYNPYIAIPSDPALARLHTAETRNMNNQDVPSPYPAGAQFFFRAVTAVSDSAFAFKIALAIINLAIVLLLFLELRQVHREAWVLAYAWHPLIVTCVSYNSHIDLLGVLLLLLSLAALKRGNTRWATIAFGLAVAVKFLPAVLAPLYWRRVRVIDVFWTALVVGLLYLPFIRHGALPLGSLATFVQRFRFNDPVFALLTLALQPQIAAAIAVCAGLAVALFLRFKYADPAPEQWVWPMAASLFCSPVIYPWYLLWLVPFLGSSRTVTLTIWTLSIISVFTVWHWNSKGLPWQVPGWALALEFGSVAIAAIIALIARRLPDPHPISEQ